MIIVVRRAGNSNIRKSTIRKQDDRKAGAVRDNRTPIIRMLSKKTFRLLNKFFVPRRATIYKNSLKLKPKRETCIGDEYIISFHFSFCCGSVLSLVAAIPHPAAWLCLLQELFLLPHDQPGAESSQDFVGL